MGKHGPYNQLAKLMHGRGRRKNTAKLQSGKASPGPHGQVNDWGKSLKVDESKCP